MDVRLAAGPRLRAALGGPLALPGGWLRSEPAEISAGEAAPPAGADLTFDGDVLVAGRHRRLSAASAPAAGGRSFHVAVEGVGSFAVAGDGGALRQLSEAPGAARPALLEVALGPPLVLALALRGVFCLHASAARAPSGGALLFLGDSGCGKSTLAAHLDARAGWCRLSDDVTPVDDALRADPRFPQLSLPDSGAEVAAEPAAVETLCLLQPGDRLHVEPVPVSEAVRTVVRQTVAARLFDPPLLAAHLEWAGRLAAAGVHRLEHPHGADHLPAVAAAVERLTDGGR